VVRRDALQTDVVVHLDGPPAVQIRKGVARVVDHTGGIRIERAMAVEDLAKYVERGRRALRQHADGADNIVVDD
jgi:NaMN:DMB phosphoribosyltransferase